MEIEIRYRGKKQVLKFDKSTVTALDILKTLGLSSEHAFVIKNGEIAQENDIVTPQDEIKVVNAISGG